MENDALKGMQPSNAKSHSTMAMSMQSQGFVTCKQNHGRAKQAYKSKYLK